jgi:hypothetical protein
MRLRLSASNGSSAEYSTVALGWASLPLPAPSSISPMDLALASSVRSYAVSAARSAWRYRPMVLTAITASSGSKMPSNSTLRSDQASGRESITVPPSAGSPGHAA